ncbi:hypothetical protein [Mangrovibacterium lignilyticum]|uniref:hypothetical protein n=1 Tax=Mangrovibacterium lignilyticum TaxID=2668052 RepID=UPI0013D46DB9|nr:hypothetical protein [Mangrovibacterium lignilyticum]
MATRNYHNKDVDMLMASKTILISFRTNLAELSLIRTNWTDLFATAVETRITSAINKYLGLDKKAQQRQATHLLESIKQPAQKALSFLKTQIEVDFKPNAAEILQTLGYQANWAAVQNDDQEALIQLLYAFDKGMTDELKTEIAGKGTNPVLIETIIGYAAQMEQANVNQESLKQTSQEITEEALAELNAIYDEIIGICKIAAQYYEDKPLLAAQFTFSRVVANMNNPVTKTEEVPE